MLALALATLTALSPQDAPAWEADRAAARGLDAPTPSLETLDSWSVRLRPSGDELGWAAIPWVPSFSEGIRRADAEGKPLLFWAMNGHPLGCT